MVSMRTVVPDLMRSTGGTRAEIYPQTTVPGVDPNVTSGLFADGDGCAVADVTTASATSAASQSIGDLQTCLHIRSALSGSRDSGFHMRERSLANPLCCQLEVEKLIGV